MEQRASSTSSQEPQVNRTVKRRSCTNVQDIRYEIGIWDDEKGEIRRGERCRKEEEAGRRSDVQDRERQFGLARRSDTGGVFDTSPPSKKTPAVEGRQQQLKYKQYSL
ncbi:hypothetical protein CBL_04169 [Carabus blaptoides fortunei]